MASYTSYQGYYGGTYRGIPQGAIPAPPGVPYPNTPWGSNPGGTPNQYPGYIFYPGIHLSGYPLACQIP